MQFVFRCEPLINLTTEALVLPLLGDVPFTRVRGLDQHRVQLLTVLNQHGDWKGDLGEVTIFYPDHAGLVAAKQFLPGIKRLVLVGMGQQADWSYEKMRRAVAGAVVQVKQRAISELTLVLPQTMTPATVRDLATITELASYRFSTYKTVEKTDQSPLETVGFWLTGELEAAPARYAHALSEGKSIGQSTNYVRDLINHPANVMTPRHLARDAQELADDHEVTVTVYDRQAMIEMGMGGIVAIAQGSIEEPQLIVVDYHPQLDNSEVSDGVRYSSESSDSGQKSAKKTIPTIGLVGKGITFDAGGISIKPSDGMEEMKMDMAGAATCLGVIAAAKALRLPIHLVAVLPTAENLPSGRAVKPGDIVTAYDGQTIEIVNTDAEGRVVMADSLAYLAKNWQPEALIDVATLTGAAIVALGYEAAALFGNDDDLIEKVKAAAERTGERVWQLPLWEEYRQLTKSEVADVQNIGAGRRNAAVITAAAFLASFVPPTMPWVHLDMAGPAMLDKARAYYPKGGSGWGVRLLVDLLEHWPRNE